MDPFEQKISQIIDKKLNSMSNLANSNHAHNGYDVNQLDPSVALLGFPVITATRGALTTSTLFGGSGSYVSHTNVVTTGGTGTGLLVNTTAVAGVVTVVTISFPGTGYTVGDVITITGGDGTATFHIATISDASVAPTDTPINGTFRFYVDTSPKYYLWAYLVYQNSSTVLTGSWKSTQLT